MQEAKVPKKILVLNPLAAKLDSALKKANQINVSNGPFDTAFLLGNVLPENDTKLPDIDIPTYFTEGISSIEPQLKSANNFSYLGNYGVKMLDNGINIGFVTGKIVEQDKEQINKFVDAFQEQQLDILLTYQWPTTIASKNNVDALGCSAIDEIVCLCKPRYIFSCGKNTGLYYEQDPFKWKDSQRVTRFISLGQYKSKQKWFYAFNFVNEESSPEDIFKPNPFEETSLKRTTETDDTAIEKKRKLVVPAVCYFCLSNPNAETHMIISIGTQCYMTIAKGPLTRPNKSKNKPISGHALIMPIDHISMLKSILAITNLGAEDNSEKPIIDELFRFETSVKSFFYKEFNMGTYRFEINTRSSAHYHRQIMPINLHVSIDKIMKTVARLTKMFHNKRNHKKYAIEKTPMKFHLIKNSVDNKPYDKVKQIVGENGEYICIELYVVNLDNKLTGNNAKKHENDKEDGFGQPFIETESENTQQPESYLLVSAIDSTKYVDLQFPRFVIATFLNMNHRLYWNKCTESQEMETIEAESFRKLYKNYDFTVE